MSDAATKHQLAERAQALGCAALGAARAGPVADHARLQAWIDRGQAADLRYLVDDGGVRADPRRAFPPARSVVVVAVPYPTTAPRQPRPAGRLGGLYGGQDYHVVVRQILTELGTMLSPDPTRWRAFVDTGPLLERSLAVSAGVGVRGRHTQLLVDGHGARVVLGVLLTCDELEPDAPRDDDPCEGCDACLRACPTGALHAEHGLDAGRCLSYWTTSNRGPIPASLRRPLGNRVYGCDTCLRACPLEPASPRTPPSLPALTGETGWDHHRLHQLLALSGRGLLRELEGHAMAWIGRAAIRRTLCVVLGNHGHPESVSTLAAALEDANPMVRGHAAWALGQLGGEAARRTLDEAAQRETDPDTQQELTAAIARLRL